MQVGALTESLEDYLEIIFRLVQEHKVARVRDIAKAKDVKTSSVVSALQRLAKEGLVEYQAREYVDLTEEGRELAFSIDQRHHFLKTFLSDLLQVDPETAEKDACSLEHALSLSTMERLAAFTEFITYCPKVDHDLVIHFRDNWLNRWIMNVIISTNCPNVESGRSRNGLLKTWEFAASLIWKRDRKATLHACWEVKSPVVS